MNNAKEAKAAAGHDQRDGIEGESSLDRYEKNIEVLGVRFNAVSQSELIELIEGMPTSTESAYVCFSNVSVLVNVHGKSDEIEVLNSATINAIDGMPICWIAKSRKITDAERNSGPDIMKIILENGLKKGCRHFFYGTTPDTLDRLRKQLEERFPGILVAGMHAPPFKELTAEEDAQIVNIINDAEPDYVWVGLGAPKQDIWMSRHKKSLKNCKLMGVGAAFNFFSGDVKRAPQWMQRCGLEWLYRLLKEPKRLWRRYLVGNLRFLWYLAADRMSRK